MTPRALPRPPPFEDGGRKDIFSGPSHAGMDVVSRARRATGSAEFFLGPMFSEKTTSVGRRIKRARLGGLACVFVKSATDVRYGAGPAIRTHGGASIEASPATDDLGRLRIVEARRLLGVELAPDEFDVGVDEGQFFPDLREALDAWMREGRRVYVAALDGDFCRKAFPAVAAALPLATRIVKLTAVCMLCGVGEAGRQASRLASLDSTSSGIQASQMPRPPAEAYYTVRTVGGKLAPGEFDVGAKDKYKAACLDCYCLAALNAS
jgi:thymidine kinase